ncbi:hypothetical protein [Pandoraea capi]
MPIPEGAQALANTRKVLAFADHAGMPVFQIQHVAPDFMVEHYR